MTRLTRAALVVALGMVSLSTAAAQGHDHPATSAGATGDLGEISFENSGSPAARPHFVRGVLLLHSFQYAEAVDAFREAQRVDRDFAMAYWGEAMAYNHSLWNEQDRVAANQVLARLGGSVQERLAKAPTSREKAYLAAVHTLYGDGPKRDRDLAYAAAMERLAAAHPEDLEAQAFHALATLGLGRREPATAMRAAAIAEEVYASNPRHPGAAHYLIHAYDDAVHAPLGLRAASAYARLAPGSAHALHMPSHIFFRLGRWDAVIEANTRSLAAERRAGRVGTHAMHWLVYAYLQQGRRDEALALLRTLEEALKRPGSSLVRYAKAQICATWVMETGSDRDAPCDGEIDRSGITAIGTFVEYELARGLVAARRNDLGAAKGSLDGIRRMITQGRAAVRTDAAASRVEQVTEQELALAVMMAMELEAALLHAEGRHEDALRRAADAVAAEEAATARTEPPGVPKSARELRADLLLAAGKLEEARQQYEAALQRTPGRTHVLVGLLQALERSGDVARAADLREQLRKQWRRGELPVVGAR